MAPINTPNGNEVSEIVLPNGNPASEVIAPDGTQVFGAIPDSVVDNFEDADANPRGVYESNDTISDFYTGDTGSFDRTTSNAVEGSTALKSTGTTFLANIVSQPGDGLNAYPQEGDRLGFLIRDTGTFPFFLTNADSTGTDAYGFRLRANDSIQIQKITGGSNTELSSVSISESTNTWYWGEAVTPTSGDNTITFELYNLNAVDLTRGSLIDSVTANDNEYATNRGIGFARGSGSDQGANYDWVRIL